MGKSMKKKQNNLCNLRNLWFLIFIRLLATARRHERVAPFSLPLPFPKVESIAEIQETFPPQEEWSPGNEESHPGKEERLTEFQETHPEKEEPLAENEETFPHQEE